MEERSKVRAAALLAAAAGALGGLGTAMDKAAAAGAEFNRVLEQQQAERKAEMQRQQHRTAQMRAYFSGLTGGWRVPNLKVLAKTGWTNASYRRAARKRKNVQRNRRAHRG